LTEPISRALSIKPHGGSKSPEERTAAPAKQGVIRNDYGNFL